MHPTLEAGLHTGRGRSPWPPSFCPHALCSRLGDSWRGLGEIGIPPRGAGEIAALDSPPWTLERDHCFILSKK